ncbi:universal stress protein [Klenkia terrae]|uniref:universal stress protein n=1 Tax=Klenkia terrae TaxID=1052259 RepID=UPI0036138D60
MCVLRVVDWPEAGIAGLPPDLDGRSATRAAAELQVRWLVARLAQWLPVDRITGEVVDGDPVHVLRARSQDLDLLVVGAHGQAWSSGETLGSIAAGVVRGRPAPSSCTGTSPPSANPTEGSSWASTEDPAARSCWMPLPPRRASGPPR